MVIGKLVSHPCGSQVSARCATCHRAMCQHHLDGSRCVQCAGKYAPPLAPLSVSEGELMAFDPSEIAAFDEGGAPPAHFHGDS